MIEIISYYNKSTIDIVDQLSPIQA